MLSGVEESCRAVFCLGIDLGALDKRRLNVLEVSFPCRGPKPPLGTSELGCERPETNGK